MSRLLINGRFLSQPVTGVQRYARELLHEFDQLLKAPPFSELWQETVLLIPKQTPTENLRLNVIRPQVVGRLSGHAWEQFELSRQVRKNDTLFCPGNCGPVWPLLLKRRVVVTIHDLSYHYFPEAYSTGYKFLYHLLTPAITRHARAIITVSQSERSAILECHPEAAGRLTAIQNGKSPQILERPATGSLPRLPSPYILYIGSLSKRKNFDGLLQTAESLLSRWDGHFIIVGSRPEALTQASLTSIHPRIRFTGQINDPAVLDEIYRHATCFFFPSFYEASPLPPIEAMAHGLPVVCSSIPSLIERCGDAAIYCNPRSIEDMVQKLEDVVYLSAEKREELSCKSKARAELFSWQKCAMAHLELLAGITRDTP